MNEFTFMLVALVGLFVIAMAILMPIFVFIITGHVEKMRKTLESMEHLMRHGK